MAFALGSDGERRHYTPRAYAEGAEDDAKRACAGIDPANLFECIHKRVEANAQAAHDEQDLTAQQRAATSAAIAAGVGVATLVTSVVGLWLLLSTIRQGQEGLERAREANALARESIIAQLRPWLVNDGIDLNEDRNVVWNGVIQEYSVGLKIKWKNSGQSPASNVSMYTYIDVVPRGAEMPIFQFPEFEPQHAVIAAATPVTGSFMGIGKANTDQWRNREIDIVLFGRVEYKDSLPPHIDRWSEFTFRVKYNGYRMVDGQRRDNPMAQPEGPQNRIT